MSEMHARCAALFYWLFNCIIDQSYNLKCAVCGRVVVCRHVYHGRVS